MQVLRQIKNDLLEYFDGDIKVDHNIDINRNILDISIKRQSKFIYIQPYYNRFIVSGDLEKTYINKLYLKAECDIIKILKE